MNILLTGATGQLGGELLPLLSLRGHVTCIGRSLATAAAGDRRQVDLGDASAVKAVLDDVQPQLIVNAAAYTAVDLAETERQAAYSINADLPEQLAQWSHHNSAALIHYSTDYVFDGKGFDGKPGRAYLETDATHPQSVYGSSKLAGEIAITQSGCRHVIVRTAWVYSSHGKNFVLSMLNLARKGLDLKIVADQIGSPTSAANLALATDRIIDKWWSPGNSGKSGTYHYRDDGVMSWFDFAREIFAMAVQAGLLESKPSLAAIPGTEYPQAARRPAYSVLDCQKIARDFDIQPYSFKDALQAVMDELVAAKY